jgi:hypothetical protein
MKSRLMVIVFGLAMLAAACGPRAAVIESGLVETRVAATFTAIQATADAGQVVPPSPATATPLPMPTRTGVQLNAPTPRPPTATALTTPSPSGLKPADSEFPAAGICFSPQEDVVSITITAGTMPDVRCMEVRPEQRLQFNNQTGATVRLQLGRFDVTLPPGQTALLDAACGSYLAPGDHFVTVSEGAVPEIMLVDK